MKFRLFSPTQSETILDAKVFFQTQLPWTPGDLHAQALAYLAQRWKADQVKSPLQYNVVNEDGETVRMIMMQKADACWPW